MNTRRGFGHAPRPAPKTPAPEPMSAEDSERVAALKREIEAADNEHRELLAVRDGDYAHLRKTHLAGALVWNLRATLCFELGQHDAARKASATANEHAALAHKLEQTAAVDRLAELERMLSASRRDAQRLAKLE